MDSSRKRFVRLTAAGTATALLLSVLATATRAQNCCAPAVPQQGVMGETVALPNVLDIGLHYEYLRSRQMRDCCGPVDDPANTRSDWKRVTLTLSYGVIPRLSLGAVLPYLWKEKTRAVAGRDIALASDGIGDITAVVRFSLIERSFVNYRELSVGAGVKIPTGATDREQFNTLLAQELQPGTGSWDFLTSLSFYQGFEPVDFYLSGTYVRTGEYEKYRFGNHLSYALTANLHLHQRLDLVGRITGSVLARDRYDGNEVDNTGRHQVWFSPGLQWQAVPIYLRLHAFFEQPLYQNFKGHQLGSDYNLRLSATFSIPLASSEED